MPTTRLLGVPEPVTVRVPAKVNLHLSAGETREDGFHELVTVFHAVSLYDEVTATPARDLSLGVTGEGAGTLPADEGNLVWRAAVLLAERAGVQPAVRLDVAKGIPVAGGLAGGSADAAATLVACDALWGHRPGPRRPARDRRRPGQRRGLLAHRRPPRSAPAGASG